MSYYRCTIRREAGQRTVRSTTSASFFLSFSSHSEVADGVPASPSPSLPPAFASDDSAALDLSE